MGTHTKRLLALAFVVLLPFWTACGNKTTEPTEPRAMPSHPTFEQWRPTTKVTPIHLTEEESMKVREDLLNSMRKTSEAEDLTIPDLIHWTDPNHTVTQETECLKEAGYDVILGPDLQSYDYDAANSDFLRQTWICAAQYTQNPVSLLPPSREVHQVYYEYYTEFFMPCAAAHGVELNNPTLPSKEAWVDSKLAAPEDTGEVSEEDMKNEWEPTWDYTWTPATQKKFSSYAAKRKLFQDCPVSPPTQYLYP